MKTFESVSKEVDSIVDGLSMHIDEGIKRGVIAMRMAGIATMASCEGHNDEGLPYPWILVDTSKKPDHIQRKLNDAERAKVKALLKEFYTDRKSKHPLMLQDQGIFGAFRIQSVPWGQADTVEISNYQDEMNAFADFVINKLQESS